MLNIDTSRFGPPTGSRVGAGPPAAATRGTGGTTDATELQSLVTSTHTVRR